MRLAQHRLFALSEVFLFLEHRGDGTGDPRGVAAPEAGNNAAAGGALVPMLALGVPGSGTTAVLLAMLLALDIPMVGMFVRVLLGGLIRRRLRMRRDEIGSVQD